jgi:hypothetical protein
MNSPCNGVKEERMGGKNERWKEEWERAQKMVGPPLLYHILDLEILWLGPYNLWELL